MYFFILIAGFGGGMVRGLVGYIKHQYSYKNVVFNLPYFFGMSFLSGMIGVLVAASANELGLNFLGNVFNPAMAFIVGYAGGDFCESVFKIIVERAKADK